MKVLKPLHLTFGLLGLMAFILTGQYMAIIMKGLGDMPDGPRLLYRTSHLYLMWASLLNLIVGHYFTVAASRGARSVQAISSVLLLAGPVLMLTGFFLESPSGTLDREFTGWGNYFALAGAILHVAVNLKSAPEKV